MRRSGLFWIVLSVLLSWHDCLGSHLNHPKAGHGPPDSREDTKLSKFDLQQDIDDFLDLIPKEEIQNLTRTYYFGDQEVRFAYEYCQSEEFLALREKIQNLPEVRDFLKYLSDSGLNLVELVNKLARIVGPPQESLSTSEEISLEDTTSHSATHTSGVSGFVDAIVALLPQDQILSLFFLKLETSSAFSNLIERIGSSEFEKVLDFVENSRELKSLLATLHQHGIDVSKIVQSVQAFFGWGSY